MASPFATQIHAQGSYGFVLHGITTILIALNNAYIKRKAKVVVCVATPCVGHDWAWLCTSLRIECVLRGIGPQATHDLNAHAALRSLMHECSRQWLDLSEKRCHVLLASVVDCLDGATW